MKRIVADPAKCMACRACELACALAHADTEDLVEAIFEQGAKPRIYIESAGGFAVPLQCRHCEDAPCVAVCPSGAIWRTDESGPVLVDQEKCTGCTFCVEACPFGVVRLLRGDRTAVIKCDLCAERQAEGFEPACVLSCPAGALSFEEVDESSNAEAPAEVSPQKGRTKTRHCAECGRPLGGERMKQAICKRGGPKIARMLAGKDLCSRCKREKLARELVTAIDH